MGTLSLPGFRLMLDRLLGASFIAFWVLALCDLLLAALKAAGSGPALLRLAARLSAGMAAAFIALALYQGHAAPRIKRVEVPIKNLPAALDGFTIMQVSDVHLGRMTGLRRLKEIGEAAESIKPDFIAFTGDFSESREPLPSGTCDVLKKMPSRYGKAAVLGNHDMFTGGGQAADLFSACGVKVLRGEVYAPVPGLPVAGVDDLRRGGAAAVKALAASLDRSKPLVFLSHQPQGFDVVTSSGSGLVLSGHTHNGQIFPFNLVERGLFKYFNGLYSAGDYSVYVTAGAGTWGPPMRLFTVSALPVLVLRSVDKGQAKR